ncbi:hypothetical protein FZ934_07965 [Rhizobium grahamii]|uniref:Uncharacterized protein n=1 Tax=Rhizobium grahamii TaxID=1120045 RepID=A0A5Q0C4J7_9HYPH|nr:MULTISPECIES: hypothetical protein [Rhizobium]QFY60373.1 hypothetical protein FZ934_07965 [Rhizobium grahamii]QRM50501.1 hypothetical protein F3Y33_14925 [Rhizobium sp. BG6]
MKTALPVGLLIILTVAVILVGGIRIITIPPMANTPEGRTLLVRNLHGHSLIVSADRICGKDVTPGCRAGALAGLAAEAQVVLRLPHFPPLDALAGS